MNPFPPPLPSGPWHPCEYLRKSACPCFGPPAASAAGAMIRSKVKTPRTPQKDHTDLKPSSTTHRASLSPSQTDFHGRCAAEAAPLLLQRANIGHQLKDLVLR